MQQALQRQAFVAGQAGQGDFAALQQACGVGLAAVGGGQFFQRFRVQGFGGQLLDLVLQPGQAFADVAGTGQVGQLAVDAGPAAGGFTHGFEQRAVLAEGVEQGQLLAAVEQGLVFVLAVDLDQKPAQGGKLAERGRAAVDPGPRAAVGAHDPAQLAGIAVVEFVFAQPGQRGRGVGEPEFRRQFSAFGAVAHHAGVGAGAGEPHQRVHQQRLAGAGFARDHGHARPEGQFRAADDGKILEGEVAEHAGGDFA